MPRKQKNKAPKANKGTPPKRSKAAAPQQPPKTTGVSKAELEATVRNLRESIEQARAAPGHHAQAWLDSATAPNRHSVVQAEAKRGGIRQQAATSGPTCPPPPDGVGTALKAKYYSAERTEFDVPPSYEAVIYGFPVGQTQAAGLTTTPACGWFAIRPIGTTSLANVDVGVIRTRGGDESVRQRYLYGHFAVKWYGSNTAVPATVQNDLVAGKATIGVFNGPTLEREASVMSMEADSDFWATHINTETPVAAATTSPGIDTPFGIIDLGDPTAVEDASFLTYQTSEGYLDETGSFGNGFMVRHRGYTAVEPGSGNYDPDWSPVLSFPNLADPALAPDGLSTLPDHIDYARAVQLPSTGVVSVSRIINSDPTNALHVSIEGGIAVQHFDAEDVRETPNFNDPTLANTVIHDAFMPYVHSYHSFKSFFKGVGKWIRKTAGRVVSSVLHHAPEIVHQAVEAGATGGPRAGAAAGLAGLGAAALGGLTPKGEG